MGKSYIIPEELVKALLAYLQERPYKETAGGINALLSLKPLEEKKDENDVD